MKAKLNQGKKKAKESSVTMKGLDCHFQHSCQSDAKHQSKKAETKHKR